MKRLLTSISATFLTGALLTGAVFAAAPLASAQDAPSYEVHEDDPTRISVYAGLSADDWASRFIGIAQQDSGVPAGSFTYDPDDLESMRLFIWSKLEDLTIDLTGVIDKYDAKANALEDNRNIKIAVMMRAFVSAQSEPLSIEEFENRVIDITRPFARDNDWFVVFYANGLNFEAGLSEGLYDQIYPNFAEFALRGHESDLDYDEARLMFLRMRLYDDLRRNELAGYYDNLSERNDLKAKFGLPNSDFADLINAASLHDAIFSDPSTIRIAEEAFLNDDRSTENIETAKYVLATLYTAHGFSDKALEVYRDIDAAALGSDALVQAIEIDKAFNAVLLGDFEEARQILGGIDKVISADLPSARMHYDLLEIALHDEIMTPEKKADILAARQTFHHVLIETRLGMNVNSDVQPFNSGGAVIAVDKTQAMHSGNLEDLQPVSEIERDRISGFIKLAASGLGGSSKTTTRQKTITRALYHLTSGQEKELTDGLRGLRESGTNAELVELIEHYRAPEIKGEQKISSDPELAALDPIIQSRLCLKQGDYACAWEQVYSAQKAARSVGQSDFVDFLIADLKLTLMSHENNSANVLAAATDLFENRENFIADPDMAYNIVNRVAGTFERAGHTGTAYQIITLGGAAGMAQPYTNHMTEVRLMLSLSKFREARDRLDVMVAEGAPLRQTLYEKALSYASHAALGETDAALGLADQVRAGSRGLKDPLLSGLIEPYLLMGDYYVYTHYRPFEAEEYRVKYLNARRAEEVAQTEKSRDLAEARVRALNAAEMRALDKAEAGLTGLGARVSWLSSLSWLLLGGLGLLGYFAFKARRQNTALAAENAQLDHARRTHQYFMEEMERQTALETTALSSAMDTLSRSSGADPQLMGEKLSGHVSSLKESIARLAFQDRVFTRKQSTPTKINLENLRGELLESWQPAASKKDISILFDVDERVRSVHSYKALLGESLRLFVGHAIDHTSIDIITIKMTPFRLKDQDFIRAQISDEGDGLASFDARLAPGDVSPDFHAAFDASDKQTFAASTAIMAINGAGGRFESEATPGFGHVLTFDLPATLLAGADEPLTPTNIIEFKKGTANDG